tara:strand:+ start:200 stop:1183 length:984 start_codon:yes stop_codon:yes gene_type:complete
MKNNKFLSIIIPIYNNPRDVLDLLNSIKIFDRNNLEIIIIDDGSNPKLQYKFNKFNIKYFYIKNSGPAFARNFGASKSKGEYLLFLDSDLILPKKFLKKLILILKRKKIKSGSIIYGINSHLSNIFSQYKAFFDFFNISIKLKNKREKVLIGSSCVFNRKFFFLKKGWNHKIKKPSIEHEEFAKRLGPQNITRINNIFVIHKFPKGRKLFSIIFLRSRDWMYSKLNNEVEFDGLSRTKSTGFFSFQPFLFAFSFIISLIVNNDFIYFTFIPLILFLFGNKEFFLFLFRNDNFIKTLSYILIHFFFCFSVSLGALYGLFNYSFNRIFK